MPPLQSARLHEAVGGLFLVSTRTLRIKVLPYFTCDQIATKSLDSRRVASLSLERTR